MSMQAQSSSSGQRKAIGPDHLGAHIPRHILGALPGVGRLASLKTRGSTSQQCIAWTMRTWAG